MYRVILNLFSKLKCQNGRKFVNSDFDAFLQAEGICGS